LSWKEKEEFKRDKKGESDPAVWPPVAATCHRDDLQAENGSIPVENRYGKQVDKLQIRAAQINKGEVKGR
jgi:hypothetical protein